MTTARLVADIKVECACLIESEGADSIANVVENVVLGNPAARLGEAAGHEVHAVGGTQWELMVRCVYEAGTLRCRDFLIFHGNRSAAGRISRGRLSCLEVVPCIVANIVGAARLIDPEQVNGAATIAELNTDIVAVN
jgi:hypothetical protein